MSAAGREPKGYGALSAAFAASRTVAAPSPKKKSLVLSLRLTQAERDRLEREAAGRTLSDYARRKLFDGAPCRQSSRKGAAIEDHRALARVLGAMGRSPAVGTLQGVLRAAEEEALALGPEAEAALRSACAAIEAMREDLLRALGLRPG